MSVSMAVADFVPVVIFLFTSMILRKEYYGRMGRSMYTLFAAGTVMIFMAGALKASWKLLYAAGIMDFDKLNQMFFPVQSIGFILAGASLLLTMLFKRRKKVPVYSAAVVPMVFSGTMVFVVLMILGLMGFVGGLMIDASRKKKPAAILLFGIAFVMLLCMGYLASKDFSKAFMNWLAEIINIIGQLSLFVGSVMIVSDKKRTQQADEKA